MRAFFLFIAGVLASAHMLTQDTFYEAVRSKPHFVKLWAPWCSHCVQLAPLWDEYAEKYANNEFGVAKVDCTTEAELCRAIGIWGYPTLKYIDADGRVYRFSGERSIENFEEFRLSAHKNVADEFKSEL